MFDRHACVMTMLARQPGSSNRRCVTTLCTERRAMQSASIEMQSGDAPCCRLAPGQWVLGGNWDDNLWGGGLPDASWIDEVSQQLGSDWQTSVCGAVMHDATSRTDAPGDVHALKCLSEGAYSHSSCNRSLYYSSRQCSTCIQTPAWHNQQMHRQGQAQACDASAPTAPAFVVD